MMFVKVVVTGYDENWIRLFEKEANTLRNIFRKEIIAVHHIGSTSVPGLKAKPVIDIMPVVKKIVNIDDYNKNMADIGYEALGEAGLSGRRYFRRGGDNRTHNVHVFQIDNESQIERHLAVRDYLREHDDEAIKYGELKSQLAKQFPLNIYGYMEGKDAFVKALEQKALVWQKEKKRGE